MANSVVFGDDEMVIEEGLGHPKAYAKLCRERKFGSYTHGPPFAFTPYALTQEEISRAIELEAMFPVIDPKAKPTTKPKIFVNLLWKQLNHLGNAGFDPEIIRVDPYGNVLYYHADAASPLAWEIDHWFPCSRGGLTVLSNLRILQWQVCRRKHDKLEFLIPWWDFQLGISINQFLSIFASSNSDFRHRAFSWLFPEGESEELNASQTVDSHAFPQHFLELKEKVGLAPAAVVRSRKESLDVPLKALDCNRRPRSSTPIVAVKKLKQFPKENEDPMMASNPYQAIVLARDSLRQREETAKMQAEIQKLDNEVDEFQHKTEEEKLSIQELEIVLMKKKRRAEKCRKLAESQSSYRIMLEKMIRDAMHQSVVYKEQVRLNQAAASALMARLEAQKAICDSAERDFHLKYRQRDELEKQIRPEWDQGRKRSRKDELPDMQQDIETDNAPDVEKGDKAVLCLPGIESTSSSHKELRTFLEEEQRASAASLVKNEEGGEQEGVVEQQKERLVDGDELEIQDGDRIYNLQFPFHHEPEEEEDEEIRRQRGKGNIEKWLQFLLEHSTEDANLNPQKCIDEKETNRGADDEELIKKLNMVYPLKSRNTDTTADLVVHKIDDQQTVDIDRNDDEKTKRAVEIAARNSISGREKPVAHNTADCKTPPYKNPPYRIAPEKTSASGKEARRLSSPDARKGKIGKEKELQRSESARGFRRIPSSPSLFLGGMKKRVDCIGKKPSVLGDNDGDEDYSARNNFIKSSIKSIKKAVRI